MILAYARCTACKMNAANATVRRVFARAAMSAYCERLPVAVVSRHAEQERLSWSLRLSCHVVDLPSDKYLEAQRDL